MEKRKAWARAAAQLAIDFNARPEDFQTKGIVFTAPAMNPGRRVYSNTMPFLEMVTAGNSTVIMADAVLRKELDSWTAGAEKAHWLFELPRMIQLAGILAPYGYEPTQTFHYYLPSRDFEPAAAFGGLTLKWLEREDIAVCYPNSIWPNALQRRENPPRPDVLALMALDGDRPAAMAGASADSPAMWQVGIDVKPGYRGKGLGTLLVEGLSREAERRGALPFYGTSLSNIHSQNIAWKCGFRPAWVAVSARKKEA